MVVLIVAVAWIQAVATAMLLIQLPSGPPYAPLIIAAVAAGLQVMLTGHYTARSRMNLRREVVSTIFGLGAVRVEKDSGSLLNLATTSVDKATRYRAGFIGPMIGSVTTPLVVLLVVAVLIDWVSALVIALFVALIPLIIRAFRSRTSSVSGRYHRSRAMLTRSFLNAIQAIDTLVYYRAAGRIGKDLAQRGEANRVSVMRMLAVNQLLIFVVDLVFSLAVIVVAVVMALLRLEGTDAISLVLVSTLVTGPAGIIGQFFYIGMAGRAAERQIAGVAKEKPHRSEPTVTEAGLVVEKLSGGWPGAEDIVRDLTLTVAPGERVVLVGPSGAGKSTASALIQGHLQPTSGQVRSGRQAVVEQRTFLFNGTVGENLDIVDTDPQRQREALAIAGLEGEVDLGTEVGDQGRLLSGGQAQRLSIARAWLADAPVLLLDEPTSQVDLAGEAAILAALERLAADKAVLMIAHRPDAILAADRVQEINGDSEGEQS